MIPDALWFASSFFGFVGVPLLILGIKDRHGGTMGRWAWVAFGLAAAGAVVMIMPWMVPFGLLLAGLGALIAGAHMLGEGRSPRFATVLFSAGLLISLGVWVATDLVGDSVRDYWGDQVLPRVISFAAAIALFVPGTSLLAVGSIRRHLSRSQRHRRLSPGRPRAALSCKKAPVKAGALARSVQGTTVRHKTTGGRHSLTMAQRRSP